MSPARDGRRLGRPWTPHRIMDAERSRASVARSTTSSTVVTTRLLPHVGHGPARRCASVSRRSSRATSRSCPCSTPALSASREEQPRQGGRRQRQRQRDRRQRDRRQCQRGRRQRRQRPRGRAARGGGGRCRRRSRGGGAGGRGGCCRRRPRGGGGGRRRRWLRRGRRGSGTEGGKQHEPAGGR